MKHSLRCLLSIVLLALWVSSCDAPRPAATKPVLTVSIVPQQFLVKTLAGDSFEVQPMLPPGSNHETYEPSPRDMEKIAGSAFYFALGALDFELTWLDRFRASSPDMIVVNTGTGISMLSGHIHAGDDHGDHHPSGTDPHIWLSPACMKVQAESICKALTEYDTANRPVYTARLSQFNRVADSVDQEIRKILSGSDKKAFLIYHPALGYFARDYGLEQISMEQEGKEPSPAYLAGLVATARAKGIRSILVSRDFDTRNAEALAREINGKVVVFDPMAPDWAENMIRIAHLIAEN
jgi:zinc transport system substrate-binding protein